MLLRAGIVGLCLICMATSLYAQQLIHLQGQVVDASTAEPLAYAYVHVGTVGSLSNTEGRFALRIPRSGAGDTLEVTFLGYQPVRLAWREEQRGVWDIRLVPAPLTLEQVEIRPMEPRDTLRKAWRDRSDNYALHPIRLSGFYREHLREPGTPNEYFFGEGILEVYKPGFPIRGREDLVRVIKSRCKPRNGFIQVDTVQYQLPMVTQGPHLGTELDLLRIEHSFLKPSNLRAYTLGLASITKLNGRITYVFDFKPYFAQNHHAQFMGSLYIDAASLALVRASYRLNPYGIELINHDQTVMDLLERTYTVNYRKTEHYWVLQDAQVENVYRHRVLGREVRSLMTFVVTDIAEQGVRRFTLSEQVDLNDAFAGVAETVPAAFWEGFNIIVPEDSLLQDQ